LSQRKTSTLEQEFPLLATAGGDDGSSHAASPATELVDTDD
jgi:hypothetical protein